MKYVTVEFYETACTKEFENIVEEFDRENRNDIASIQYKNADTQMSDRELLGEVAERLSWYDIFEVYGEDLETIEDSLIDEYSNKKKLKLISRLIEDTAVSQKDLIEMWRENK